MNISKATCFIFLIGILFNGCLDPYAPPKVSGSSNYLVVSGFLNAGGSCSITLSRSQLLSSTDVPASVSDASVFIQDENGVTSTLTFQGYGVYSNSNLNLDFQNTYRLHIVTSNGESYNSDYVPIVQSPPIDTVGWTLSQQGSVEPELNIYVSAQGNNNQSPYYFWNYKETWEYNAAYPTDLKLINGQVVPNFDSTYFCWRTLSSTGILISSTKQLSQNVVNQFTITSNPDNSVKFLKGYSILVTQLSLTQDAFEYWQQLRATTENLGTIFGPLPSQFNGNIHSISNHSEPVFGFFSASSVSEKRIFIKPGQFPTPSAAVLTGYEDCQLNQLLVKDINNLGGSAIVSSYGVGPVGYNITSIDCVDCRLKGGTNIKPSFWY